MNVPSSHDGSMTRQRPASRGRKPRPRRVTRRLNVGPARDVSVADSRLRRVGWEALLRHGQMSVRVSVGPSTGCSRVAWPLAALAQQ